MGIFEDTKPGARLRGLDPEVVQIARFGAHALNLVIRVDGLVGERLVYRGEESGFEFLEAGRSYTFDADGALWRFKRVDDQWIEQQKTTSRNERGS